LSGAKPANAAGFSLTKELPIKPTSSLEEFLRSEAAQKRIHAAGPGKIFKQNPSIPRRDLTIHHWSAQFGRIIYAVDVRENCALSIYVSRNLVVTVDIGKQTVTRGRTQ